MKVSSIAVDAVLLLMNIWHIHLYYTESNDYVFPGKQFKCLECDFTSILKASLLRHMEQHAKFKVWSNTDMYS